jgi:hypothetical protein
MGKASAALRPRVEASMSDHRATDSSPMFAKAFIPGLVLGVIVGLAIGVFASPYVLDRSPSVKMVPGATHPPSGERDPHPMAPAENVPPITTPKLGETKTPEPGDHKPDAAPAPTSSSPTSTPKP